MAAVANNPKFAKKVGISKKVGEEFMKADKGRKFSEGGEMDDKLKMYKDMTQGKPTATRGKMKAMRSEQKAARQTKRTEMKAAGAERKEIRGEMKSMKAGQKMQRQVATGKKVSGGFGIYPAKNGKAVDSKKPGKSGNKFKNFIGKEKKLSELTQTGLMQKQKETSAPQTPPAMMKKGGMACAKPKKYARGGGIEVRGKTKGRII